MLQLSSLVMAFLGDIILKSHTLRSFIANISNNTCSCIVKLSNRMKEEHYGTKDNQWKSGKDNSYKMPLIRDEPAFLGVFTLYQLDTAYS